MKRSCFDDSMELVRSDGDPAGSDASRHTTSGEIIHPNDVSRIIIYLNSHAEIHSWRTIGAVTRLINDGTMMGFPAPASIRVHISFSPKRHDKIQSIVQPKPRGALILKDQTIFWNLHQFVLPRS